MGLLRRVFRWFLIATAAAVTLSLVAAVAAALWLHSSLPQTQGRMIIAGLQQPVSVDRDLDGIPHIQAQSDHDAYLALGFIHAQDRLWQMETTRRVGAGRLAEMAGAPLLATDKFMRGLGLYARAEEIFDRAPPDLRAALIAYADGVNAYLTTHGGAWPPEFYLVGLRPEPWRPADSLVWGQLMALRLAGDWRDELTRLALSARLTPEQIAELLDDPGDGPVTIDQIPRKAAGEQTPRKAADVQTPGKAANDTQSLALPETAALDRRVIDRLAGLLPTWLGPNSASNSWVLSGERTTTGKPLLANDPHLALEIPNTWYLARITAPGLTVTGATAPGVPFHVLGHNNRIAWGFTNTGSDVQDLFIERIDPDDPTRYLAPGGPLPFITRQETIKVKDAADVVITVRETRHGPVIGDITDGPQPGMRAGEVMAFASTSLRPDDQSAEALYRLNRAGDWAQFTDALTHFHSPQQNIAYADIAGNIGIYVAGRVPIRRAGDGALPVPGWTGAYDWTGFIPFEELPHSLNPPSGRLVNANNRVVGSDYPYPMGREWAEPFRARRIEAMIDRVTRHPSPDMARMQADVRSLAVRDLLPLMLPAVQAFPSPTPMAREAIKLLEDWTAIIDDDLAQPLIFNAWLRELNRTIYGDELGEDFPRLSWSLRPRFIAHVLSDDHRWCDDIATPFTETCETQLQTAFSAALESLAASYGPVPQRWRWGDAHRVRFSNRVLSRVPLLGPWTDLELPTPGDDSTVNRGTPNIRGDAAQFPHIHGASLRAIYDLADLAQSRFILAGGQSGNRLSPLYANMAERWRDAQYVTVPPRTPDAHHLLLTPAESAR